MVKQPDFISLSGSFYCTFEEKHCHTVSCILIVLQSASAKFDLLEKGKLSVREYDICTKWDTVIH